MIVVGGSSDTSQEQMGAFQELPQVKLFTFISRNILFSCQRPLHKLQLCMPSCLSLFLLSLGRVC